MKRTYLIALFEDVTMARMARIKMEGEAAAYHVYGRVCGSQGIVLNNGWIP
ncbi:hypothetical protein ACFL6U_21675 [Planctomycetota bacterium]